MNIHGHRGRMDLSALYKFDNKCKKIVSRYAGCSQETPLLVMNIHCHRDRMDLSALCSVCTYWRCGYKILNTLHSLRALNLCMFIDNKIVYRGSSLDRGQVEESLCCKHRMEKICWRGLKQCWIFYFIGRTNNFFWQKCVEFICKLNLLFCCIIRLFMFSYLYWLTPTNW